MSLKIIRTLFTAAAAAQLMIGCGGEESAPEPEPEMEETIVRPVPQDPADVAPPNEIVEKMDPDGKGMHLTATNPSGKKFEASIGDEVDIPAAFPEDVPIFPGSTPMASMSSADEGMIVTFKSGDEQQAIFDFYKDSLAEAGWEVLDDPMFGSKMSFDATKDSRKVSIIVAGTKGDSRVSVIVTPRD